MGEDLEIGLFLARLISDNRAKLITALKQISGIPLSDHFTAEYMRNPKPIIKMSTGCFLEHFGRA